MNEYWRSIPAGQMTRVTCIPCRWSHRCIRHTQAYTAKYHIFERHFDERWFNNRPSH